MSKFVIYTSKNTSLDILGKRNRVLIWIVSLITPFVYLIYILTKSILPDNSSKLSFILFIAFIVIVFMILIYLSTRLKKIGEIDFHQTGVIKRIGDFKEFWTYDQLDEILLYKHMMEIFWRSRDDNIKTHLIVTKFKDSKEQRFIISSHSIDYPEVSLIHVLDILKNRNIIKLSMKWKIIWRGKSKQLLLIPLKMSIKSSKRVLKYTISSGNKG